MQNKASGHGGRPVVEILEGRTLASFSPSLDGSGNFPTYTTLTVDAGHLGQPITFKIAVSAKGSPPTPVQLYYRGELIQEVTLTSVTQSRYPQFPWTDEGTYTIPAGPAVAEMFGVGLHAVSAREPEVSLTPISTTWLPSKAVAVFRVTRPRFARQPSGVRIDTLAAGSGPTLQPGDTATIQYNAYLAATYRMFSTTESQTPDSETFSVDASPEQVIPGLDAGVIGMQAVETRAISIPYELGDGKQGVKHLVPPRASLVYLVTLVSIG